MNAEKVSQSTDHWKIWLISKRWRMGENLGSLFKCDGWEKKFKKIVPTSDLKVIGTKWSAWTHGQTYRHPYCFLRFIYQPCLKDYNVYNMTLFRIKIRLIIETVDITIWPHISHCIVVMGGAEEFRHPQHFLNIFSSTVFLKVIGCEIIVSSDVQDEEW